MRTDRATAMADLQSHDLMHALYNSEHGEHFERAMMRADWYCISCAHNTLLMERVISCNYVMRLTKCMNECIVAKTYFEHLIKDAE